jgi:hypothetical protein
MYATRFSIELESSTADLLQIWVNFRIKAGARDLRALSVVRRRLKSTPAT